MATSVSMQLWADGAATAAEAEAEAEAAAAVHSGDPHKGEGVLLVGAAPASGCLNAPSCVIVAVVAAESDDCARRH